MNVRPALFILTAVAAASVNFSVALSSVSMACACALFAVGAWKDRATFLRPTGLEAAFGLYIAAELLASVFSLDSADSFYNMRRVLQISVVYCTAVSFDSTERVRTGILLLAVSCAAASVAEAFTVTAFGGDQERAMLFQLSITEGSIKMISAVLAVGMLFAADGRRWWRAAAGAAGALSLFGVMITYQRSAWMGTGVAAAVMGLYNRKILLALAIVAALLLAFSPGHYVDRLLSIGDMTDVSIRSRFQMFETGWRMFADRPVTGWGDIGFLPWYVTYATPLWQGEGGHMHNNFLQMLVSLGAPGFCAGAWLFYRLFRIHLRAAAPGPERWLGASTLSAYAGFHVLGLFEYNFGDHEVAVLLWFITGLAVSAAWRRDGAR